jgi:hypothetical protein
MRNRVLYQQLQEISVFVVCHRLLGITANRLVGYSDWSLQRLAMGQSKYRASKLQLCTYLVLYQAILSMLEAVM